MKNKIIPAILLGLLLSSCSQPQTDIRNDKNTGGIDPLDTQSVENIVSGDEYMKNVCEQVDIDEKDCNSPGYIIVRDKRSDVLFDDTGDSFEDKENTAYILSEYGVGKKILEEEYGKVVISQSHNIFGTSDRFDEEDVHVGDEIHLRLPIVKSEGGDYLSYKVNNIQYVDNNTYHDKSETEENISIVQNGKDQSRIITGKIIKE